MKRKLIILGLAAVMSLSVLSGCGSKDAANTDQNAAAETESTPEVVYTPTFMYFVSGSDAEYEEAMAVAAELEEEYGDRIKFDIHNIDETPEDKDNFPVDDGMRPVLIMLNTKNDISSMQFKCVDKEVLKNDIESALNGED